MRCLLKIIAKDFSQRLNLVRNLPTFYDANLSLSSNITKSQSLSQVFELYENMSDSYSSKHLAITSRLLIKFIAIQQSNNRKRQSKEAYQITSHVQQWRKVLTSIYSIKIQNLSSEQILDFAYFVKKTFHFKLQIPKKYPQLYELIIDFLPRLIKCLISKENIGNLSFPQIVQILHSFGKSTDKNSLKMMYQHLIMMFETERLHCTTFHLILLNKILYDDKRFRSKQEHLIINKLLTYSCAEMEKQVKLIVPYLNQFNMIQIFNAVVTADKSQGDKYLTIILQKLVSKCGSLLSPIYSKQLGRFVQTLKQPYFMEKQICRKIVSTIQDSKR